MLKNKFLTKAVDYLKIAYVELIVIAGAVFIDLLSKFLVEANVPLFDTVVLIPNFLNIFYTRNTKAGFSFDFGLGKLLGDTGLRIFFIVLTVVAVCFFAVLLYRWRHKGRLQRIAVALIIGGALGNLYDRIFLSYVRDFIEIVYFGQTWFGSTHFAIFNLADSCLVIGVVIFAVYFIFFYKEPEKVKTATTTRELNGLAPSPDGEEMAGGEKGSLGKEPEDNRPHGTALPASEDRGAVATDDNAGGGENS